MLQNICTYLRHNLDSFFVDQNLVHNDSTNICTDLMQSFDSFSVDQSLVHSDF